MPMPDYSADRGCLVVVFVALLLGLIVLWARVEILAERVEALEEKVAPIVFKHEWEKRIKQGRKR